MFQTITHNAHEDVIRRASSHSTGGILNFFSFLEDNSREQESGKQCGSDPRSEGQGGEEPQPWLVSESYLDQVPCCQIALLGVVMVEKSPPSSMLSAVVPTWQNCHLNVPVLEDPSPSPTVMQAPFTLVPGLGQLSPVLSGSWGTQQDRASPYSPLSRGSPVTTIPP